jgi:hypothetical protein
VHLFQGRHIDRLLAAGSGAAPRAKVAPPSQAAAGGAR